MVTPQSEDSHNRLDDPLLDEAAEWIGRLRAEDVSSADRVAFSRWLQRSPAHKAAFDSMADLWDGLGVVAMATRPASVSPKPQQQSRPWLFGVPALAAVAVLALVAVWVTLLAPSSYVTGPGERLQVELDDGSSLDLNTRSEVRFSQRGGKRQLEASLGSEFFLRVAPDPQRPFLIHTHHGTVEVLGTELSILHQDARARISVSSGEVAVLPSGMPESARRTLGAGEMLEMSAGVDAGDPVAAPSQHLAWREGRLVYDQVTLEELIADLNRYLPKRMALVAPELGHKRLSAVLLLGQQEAMLESLAATLPLRWVEVSDNLILIHPG